MKKQLLSLLVVAVFGLLALASKVNKIHYGAFNYDNRIEEPSPQGNYLDLADGTRMYGKKVSWKSGLLVKDGVKIDDHKYKMNEVLGYYADGVYYTRQGNEYIKRIVRGKINIYVKFTEVTSTTTDARGFTRSRTYTRTDHYAQKGNDPKLLPVAGQSDMKALVADCPEAVAMADLSNRQMRRTIKKNRNYLNSIFEVYNRGCKP